jgi:ribosomal protein S18 acetylase RimI-like enzyme
MEISLRPMRMSDVPILSEIDHSFHTDHVWQMDLETSEEQVTVGFRRIRLPRSMKVEYPRQPVVLAEKPLEKAVIFVAEIEGEPAGYLAVSTGGPPGISQVIDWAVFRRLRKNGVGTSLVGAALKWNYEHQAGQLILEMQSKNYPAISLANKLGFEFCGYSDRYYPNQDIALFFAKRR